MQPGDLSNSLENSRVALRPWNACEVLIESEIRMALLDQKIAFSVIWMPFRSSECEYIRHRNGLPTVRVLLCPIQGSLWSCPGALRRPAIAEIGRQAVEPFPVQISDLPLQHGDCVLADSPSILRRFVVEN
jgi:hypothetical protein